MWARHFSLQKFKRVSGCNTEKRVAVLTRMNIEERKQQLQWTTQEK